MTKRKLVLDEKLFESVSSRDLFSFTRNLLWKRFRLECSNRLQSLKNKIIEKPFGKIFVNYHLLKGKIHEKAYNLGWVKQKRDTFETEFDRKTENCYYRQFKSKLYQHCQENDKGNTSFYAVQNNQPCFTALGAWAHKEWINKHEFHLDTFPYARSFARNVPVNTLQNNMESYKKFVRRLFIDSMDIDEHYTVNESQAFYSKGLLNLYHVFSLIMFQNEEMDFWLDRFLKAYMRLVYLEQKKMDVNLKHIHDLREKWEQEVVNEFMLGVTLIGVSNYAFVFKSLPFRIQKRVPNFHARSSYEKKGTYRKPTHQFSDRKNT